ncbi:MAG: phytanoyl-CoA dioxygenase family protein [Bacteroidota bacterium]
MNSIQRKFKEDGYVVVRDVFSREEIAGYLAALDQLSVGRKAKWTQPDGVCQHAQFWTAIFNQKILANVRGVLDSEIKFLQHNDLHVGFSSFGWHRDSVCRTFGHGPDWDESEAPYKLVRVGVYLQEKKAGFRLGMIPGTQRPDYHLSEEEIRKIEQGANTLSKVKSMLGAKDYLSEKAHWIATAPGDCIIFCPRTYHTGSEFKRTKYSFFLAYGVENRHFRNHYNYYRHLRHDLGYSSLHPVLRQQLESANLYSDETLNSQKIEGAWLPSKAFQLVAKQFK